MSTDLDRATAVGDAVLYEGYLLYPYRASAGKNRFRWQWGVLMPAGYARSDSGEYSAARAECLLEARAGSVLHLRLRFLHARSRTVREFSAGTFRDVDSLRVDGVEYTSWDEALEREIDAVLPVSELLTRPMEVPVSIPASETVEELGEGARLLRTARSLSGVLRAELTPLDGPFGGARLRVDVTNTGEAAPSERTAALREAMLATHVLLGTDSGHFLSMLDPPEWARAATEACTNEHMWPVLIGAKDRGAAVLCSPIILEDDPEIAAESQGPLFDGTEIDEILTLRTMALTDDEKREARATDPRAAEIIDRVDGMPGEWLQSLHGTVRYLDGMTAAPAADPQAAEATEATAQPDVPWWDPGSDSSVSPDSDGVVVAGVRVSNGSPVTLRPGLRRADAQDMFLTGRAATVRAVLFDVDGGTHLAVTLDEDPAADLQDTHGRYRYFCPEEIEPRENSEASP